MAPKSSKTKQKKLQRRLSTPSQIVLRAVHYPNLFARLSHFHITTSKNSTWSKTVVGLLESSLAQAEVASGRGRG